METISVNIKNLKFVPSNFNFLSKKRTWEYLNGVLLDEGAFAYNRECERVLGERIQVFGTWQMALQIISYLFFGLSSFFITEGNYIIGGISFLGSLYSFLLSKIWFANKLDAMIRGFELSKELNKDIRGTEKIREELIREKESKNKK